MEPIDALVVAALFWAAYTLATMDKEGAVVVAPPPTKDTFVTTSTLADYQDHHFLGEAVRGNNERHIRDQMLQESKATSVPDGKTMDVGDIYDYLTGGH